MFQQIYAPPSRPRYLGANRDVRGLISRTEKKEFHQYIFLLESLLVHASKSTSLVQRSTKISSRQLDIIYLDHVIETQKLWTVLNETIHSIQLSYSQFLNRYEIECIKILFDEGCFLAMTVFSNFDKLGGVNDYRFCPQFPHRISPATSRF